MLSHLGRARLGLHRPGGCGLSHQTRSGDPPAIPNSWKYPQAQPGRFLPQPTLSTALVVPQDIAQVMAYAATQGCPQAMLIYPAGQPRSLTTFARAGHDVRLGVFELSGDLESAGQAFLRDLLGFVAD